MLRDDDHPTQLTRVVGPAQGQVPALRQLWGSSTCLTGSEDQQVSVRYRPVERRWWSQLCGASQAANATLSAYFAHAVPGSSSMVFAHSCVVALHAWIRANRASAALTGCWISSYTRSTTVARSSWKLAVTAAYAVRRFCSCSMHRPVAGIVSPSLYILQQRGRSRALAANVCSLERLSLSNVSL